MRRFEDFRKIVFNENTVYVKHTVTSTLLCLESDLQLSYYLRGGRLYSEKTSDWILCVWSDRV